jgi:ubiquitin-conjugating enzyme E2 variant
MASVLGFSTWLSHTAWTTMGAEQLPWVAATALLAYLGADLLSGLVHWAADRLGDERTPILGPALIRPFREHHADPLAITHHDFVETNGNNCLFGLPWMASAAVIMPAHPGPLAYACLGLGLTMAFLVATNQIHKWAHATHPPQLVRGLQRAGLVLTAEHHAIHHRAPHSRCYCITTGWLNPLLDRVRLFARLERGLVVVFPRLLGPSALARPVAHSTSTRV